VLLKAKSSICSLHDVRHRLHRLDGLRMWLNAVPNITRASTASDDTFETKAAKDIRQCSRVLRECLLV